MAWWEMQTSTHKYVSDICKIKYWEAWNLLKKAAGGTGNIVPVEGRMDSTKYQEILEANVQRSVHILKLKRGWVFYQDNDLKHT